MSDLDSVASGVEGFVSKTPPPTLIGDTIMPGGVEEFALDSPPAMDDGIPRPPTPAASLSEAATAAIRQRTEAIQRSGSIKPDTQELVHKVSCFVARPIIVFRNRG